MIPQPIDEEEAVARERILAEARHQAAQALEALPQIGRRGYPHARLRVLPMLRVVPPTPVYGGRSSIGK